MSTANADTVTCDDSSCKTTAFELENDGAGNSKVDLTIATDVTDNKTNASGNTVTIKSTSKVFRKEARSVFGAYRDDNTTAENNNIIMSGGRVARDGGFGTFAYVIGAQSKGDVNNNTVTISDDAELARAWGNNYANIHLIGGKTKGGSGSATSNKVIINGGKINIDELIGGDSESGNADGNTIEINGGQINVGGDADSNDVNMHNGVIAGGRAEKNRQDEKGESTNNTVKITGGIIEDFGSDITKVLGGHGYDVVSGNKVEITGGTVKADVYGGYSLYGEAKDNTVTIRKGSKDNPTFGDETILGGFYTKKKTKYDEGEQKGSNNTLNLHTTGLKVKNITNFDKINFYVQPETKAGDIFLRLTDKPFKDEEKKIDHKANTDISKAKISIGVEGSDARLNVGDKLTLIEKQGGSLLTGDLTNYKGDKTVTGMQGIAATYNFTLKKEGENLIAETTDAKEDPNYKPTPTEPTTPVKPTPTEPTTPPTEPTTPVKPTPTEPTTPVKPTPTEPTTPVKPTPTEPTTPVKPTPTEPTTPVKPTAQQEIARVAGKVHPQTKSLLESALSSVSFVNTGADLLSKQGMHQLTRVHNKNQDGLHVFGAVAGSDLITETGSEIDVRGTTLLVGVGKQLPNKMLKAVKAYMILITNLVIILVLSQKVILSMLALVLC